MRPFFFLLRPAVIWIASLLLTALALAQTTPPQDRKEFFDSDRMYYFRLSGWDPTLLAPPQLGEFSRSYEARLEIFIANPHSPSHCPDQESGDHNHLFSSWDIQMKMSGNRTFGTPKSSYKFKLGRQDGGRYLGMSKINLKSMWNDVSQMREALAWGLFKDAGLASSGHTYAKLCINGKYYGLYSVIEEVDESFLEDRFGQFSEGNLYKAYWEDIGPATLEYREDGVYFISPDPEKRTYQLKTNGEADDPAEHQNYQDLAELIRRVHFRQDIEAILNVEGFLKWAVLNMLMGAWDNYWLTPANYYLYNAGRGNPKAFMNAPYFHWIPWDYDNSFGTSWGAADWQYKDIVEFTTLPLVKTLLEDPRWLRFYLDQVEKMLDDVFNPTTIDRRIRGYWNLISTAAFLESDSPQGTPHTGRQFTNDQVYWNGREHRYLDYRGLHSHGILHYVRMRHDSARQQLSEWRIKLLEREIAR